jgi:hypothetical protein
MAIHKIPSFNQTDSFRNLSEEKKERIRNNLQSLTGIIFENSVSLTNRTIDNEVIKIKKMVNSMNLSKILATEREKYSFAERILLRNNYENITPLWGKMVGDNAIISAQEFHEN